MQHCLMISSRIRYLSTSGSLINSGLQSARFEARGPQGHSRKLLLNGTVAENLDQSTCECDAEVETDREIPEKTASTPVLQFPTCTFSGGVRLLHMVSKGQLPLSAPLPRSSMFFYCCSKPRYARYTCLGPAR